MKKYLIFLLIAAFFGCQNNEVDRLKAKNDSLQKATGEKEKALNEFVQALNEIQDNLNQIKEKEGLIDLRSKGKKEISPDSVTRINEDIVGIYKLLLRNKYLINTTNERLKESNIKMDSYAQMVERLTKESEAKDNQISKLKDELQKRNVDIEKLNAMNNNLITVVEEMSNDVDIKKLEIEQKNKIIERQVLEMNTGYYISGTKKDLISVGILVEKGGFVGIGKKMELNKNLDKNSFIAIDISKTKVIPLTCKKAILITQHPEAAYGFSKNGEKIDGLAITNSDSFWSVSKYLVVVIN